MIWLGVRLALFACVMQIMLVLSPLFLSSSQRSFCVQIERIGLMYRLSQQHKQQQHLQSFAQQQPHLQHHNHNHNHHQHSIHAHHEAPDVQQHNHDIGHDHHHAFMQHHSTDDDIETHNIHLNHCDFCLISSHFTLPASLSWLVPTVVFLTAQRHIALGYQMPLLLNPDFFIPYPNAPPV